MQDQITCRWPWAGIFWDVVPNAASIWLVNGSSTNYSCLNEEWYNYFQKIEDSILALVAKQQPWEFITLDGYVRMKILARACPLVSQYCKLSEVNNKVIIRGHRLIGDEPDISRYEYALTKLDRYKKCKDAFKLLPIPIAENILFYVRWASFFASLNNSSQIVLLWQWKLSQWPPFCRVNMVSSAQSWRRMFEGRCR